MSFFKELKRRNVFRVGVAYAVVGWLIMQVTDTFAPALRLPEWFPTAVAFLLILGFPIAVFFAWAFEITPEGIKREREIGPGQSLKHTNARKLDRMIIVALVAVVVVLLIDRYMGDAPAEPADESPDVAEQADQPAATPEPVSALPAIEDTRTSVGVLPFVNMSDDRQNEYFSDGISEELLNVLVRINDLRVPSRTSSFTFKGSDKKLADIGRELGVDHVLEGSVRKAGQQIRVTAQLIDVRSDTHLWSDSYTRELDDIFAVQDEIAQAIVEALKLTLSVGDEEKLARHSTANVAAYNKYLLGRHLWNERTRSALLAAVEPLREAVEMDPEFDKAWAALADTYVLFPEYSAGSPAEAIPLAREAAEKALSINPDSARALTTRAYYKALYDYDWEGSEADFRRAIELEPGYATAHHWYGETMASRGRIDEGIARMDIGRDLDPLSAVITHTPGYLLNYSNRFDEAEARYAAALKLDPYFRWTFQNRDIMYTMQGRYEEAREQVRKLAAMEGFDPAPDLARIDAVENPELKPRALELLAQRRDITEGVFGKAMQYALLDEYELALEHLEKAFAAGDAYSVHMSWVKIYDPLRDNPRFQAMLRKMNLLP